MKRLPIIALTLLLLFGCGSEPDPQPGQQEITEQAEPTRSAVTVVLPADCDQARQLDIFQARRDSLGLTDSEMTVSAATNNRIELNAIPLPDSALIMKAMLAAGNLEFRGTFDNGEYHAILDNMNQALRQAVLSNDPQLQQLPFAFDYGIALQQKAPDSVAANDINPIYDLLVPSLASQGDQWYFAPGPVLGHTTKEDLPKVHAAMNLQLCRQQIPAGVLLFWGARGLQRNDGKQWYSLFAVSAEPSPDLSSYITQATPAQKANGAWSVSLEFSDEGAAWWEQFTAANRGRDIAVLVDGEVWSTPTVIEAIHTGNCELSGDFTQFEAIALSTILSLPHACR